MKILGIDTSTKTMSIALISDDQILGEINFYSNMDHSEKLVDNINFLLKSNDTKVEDLDLIGVAVGPGSFTGVRIGIATVKGLCEFRDIKTVPVSSLEILSRNFSSSKHVAVAVDAKRNRVYGALYDYENEEVLLKEGLYNIDEFIEEIKDIEDLILASDIIPVFKEKLGDSIRYGKEGNLINKASNLCFIAKRESEKNNEISHEELKANYMTRSQAQIDFEKRKKNENRKS